MTRSVASPVASSPRLLGTATLLFLCIFGAAHGRISAQSPTAVQSTPAAQAQPAAQAASTTPAKPADYSSEPYVVEKLISNITCENDGNCTIVTSVRVRVQSAAGIQAFGQVGLSYPSAMATANITSVAVTKPNGDIVKTPADDAIDMPAEVTQQAPEYSDIKVKKVAVRGLEAGDTLEFSWREAGTKPLTPGQFWYFYNFTKDAIALQEELTFSSPQNRSVRIQSPDVQPTITEQGGYRTYDWKTSNLSHPDSNHKKPEPEQGLAPPPDVQISSFESWNAVGQWFRGLAAPRAAPTPEIKAKADALTANAKTDAEKIQILYDFVSTKFRYIGISLGVGRYQPHSAAEVLDNGFGDCKDKHTLLAALLAAENIKAYPVLVDTSGVLDVALPSPILFDHVITAVPQGDGYLFLDSTPEVAPFGYLSQFIRDKKVLVMPDAGPAQIVSTPADLPFPSFLDFHTDTTLDNTGAVKSKIQASFRGDVEVALRTEFQETGQPQWNDLVQRISRAWNFGGTVTEATVSPPDSTAKPFAFGYNYVREHYDPWDNKQISPPLPHVDLADIPEGADAPTTPIRLGKITETLTADVELPEGTNPEVSAPVDIKSDFAEYQSSYSFANGKWHSERREIVKVDMLDPSQFAAYRKFAKAVGEDEDKLFSVYAPSAAPSSRVDTSGSPMARVYGNAGMDAENRNDWSTALQDFKSAVAVDPNYAWAWESLGYADIMKGSLRSGTDETKKAIDLDPGPAAWYATVAARLALMKKDDLALEIISEIEKSGPTDPEALETISDCLSTMKRYPEALEIAERIVKSNPHNVRALLREADLLAKTGKTSDAIAPIEQAVGIDPSPNTLNLAAWILVDNNLKLDEALQYGQKAVGTLETGAVSLSPDNLDEKQTSSNMALLAMCWDTLGWIEFKLDHPGQGETYILAAWKLSFDGGDADHLGQIYEQLGRRPEATQYYELALDTHAAPEDTESRLRALNRGKLPRGGLDPGAISMLRTVAVSRIVKEHASADFDLIVQAGTTQPEVTAVKFVSGDDTLRNADAALKSAKFDVSFPDDTPTRILLHGTLDCEADTGCSFVLTVPEFIPPQL